MIYVPPPHSHKGQNGKVLIVAGSRKYHGSAVLAVKAAIPFVDKVYYYPPENDPYLITAVKNISEVIVVYDFRDVLAKVDSVLIGPGMGSIKIPLEKFKGMKRVIDADAISYVSKGVLDKNAMLTPHKGEFEDTFKTKFSKKDVMWMAQHFNTNILLKGYVDYLSDGKTITENNLGNSGMTKGGSGDALAGFITAMMAKNDVCEGTLFALRTYCKAADELFKEKLYYYTPSDIIERLPYVMKKEVEAGGRKRH